MLIISRCHFQRVSYLCYCAVSPVSYLFVQLSHVSHFTFIPLQKKSATKKGQTKEAQTGRQAYWESANLDKLKKPFSERS
jgi:hypothetical protein